MLPECSTTLKRLDRPSVRPLRTGLSLVVVDRAQAEPPPPLMVRCWRLQRLRSLEVDVPSSLDVEPKIRSAWYYYYYYIYIYFFNWSTHASSMSTYLKTLGVGVLVIHTWANNRASRCDCELCPAMWISAGSGPRPAGRWWLKRAEETRLWCVKPLLCCRKDPFEGRRWCSVRQSVWTWTTCSPSGWGWRGTVKSSDLFC